MDEEKSEKVADRKRVELEYRGREPRRDDDDEDDKEE